MNGDGQLEKKELDSAMQKPLIREQLANYIVKHPSEWKWDAAKWNALDEVIPDDEDSQKDWANEKRRIEKLCWWDEVAALGIDGFLDVAVQKCGVFKRI